MFETFFSLLNILHLYLIFCTPTNYFSSCLSSIVFQTDFFLITISCSPLLQLHVYYHLLLTISYAIFNIIYTLHCLYSTLLYTVLLFFTNSLSYSPVNFLLLIFSSLFLSLYLSTHFFFSLFLSYQ